MNNYILIIAVAVITIIIVFVLKMIGDKYFEKMSKALEEKDFETFNKISDTKISRLIFSPFNLNYLKFNAAIVGEDENEIETCLKCFDYTKIIDSQKDEIYSCAFNYYMSKNNYEKANEYKNKILNESNNIELRDQVVKMYDIYALKSIDYLDELLIECEETDDKERGFVERLICETYKNLGDPVNSKKYNELSLRHFEMMKK